MNQHFVPEFYLKNFSPNGKQIFVYDKIIKKSFSSSISSIASKEGFYDDSNNNSIENNIGRLESKTGVVVKELIALIENKQFIKVSKYQKDILLKFIWLQTNRTVESRIEYATLEPLLYSKLSNTDFKVDANDLLKNSKSTDEHIKLTNSSLNNSFALNS